ncbi:hypothetical protein MKC48_21965, partial [[Clostridium] innocuum]|nr:hypothetical protein [[Clostridium] innocuum]MCR0626483.1 hypothetical protein [[Clostridium] innocuum]
YRKTCTFHCGCPDYHRLSAVFYLENGRERLTKDSGIGYTYMVPDFRSKMKKMVLNHLIKHHFYLLWR